jgi:hypothetical protein
LSGLLILAGYAVLIWVSGWWGVLAGCAHIGIMLLAVKRR